MTSNTGCVMLPSIRLSHIVLRGPGKRVADLTRRKASRGQVWYVRYDVDHVELLLHEKKHHVVGLVNHPLSDPTYGSRGRLAQSRYTASVRTVIKLSTEGQSGSPGNSEFASPLVGVRNATDRAALETSDLTTQGNLMSSPMLDLAQCNLFGETGDVGSVGKVRGLTLDVVDLTNCIHAESFESAYSDALLGVVRRWNKDRRLH